MGAVPIYGIMRWTVPRNHRGRIIMLRPFHQCRVFMVQSIRRHPQRASPAIPTSTGTRPYDRHTPNMRLLWQGSGRCGSDLSRLWHGHAERECADGIGYGPAASPERGAGAAGRGFRGGAHRFGPGARTLVSGRAQAGGRPRPDLSASHQIQRSESCPSDSYPLALDHTGGGRTATTG